MAGENVVGLDIVARLDQFRSEMEKIPGIGGKEAKALTAQLSREIKSAETAAKKAADAAKSVKPAMEQATDATKKFGDASGAVGSNASKLTGILGMLSPEAAAAASAIADLADVGEVGAVVMESFGGVAAGLAVPLGVAGLALFTLYGLMNDYTAATKAAEHAQTSLALALAPLDEAIASARDEQQLLNDALDSGHAKKYLAIADLSAKADAKEAEATKALREEKEALMQTLAESANMDNFAGQLAQNRIKEIDREIGKVHEKANELARLSVANSTARKFIDGLRDSEEASNKATVKGTDATKDLEEARRKGTAAALAYVDALHEIEDVGVAAERSQMDAYEKLADDRERQLATIEKQKKEAAKQAAAAGGDYAQAEAKAEERAVVSRASVWDAYYADLDTLRKEDAAKAKVTTNATAEAEAAALEQLYTDGANAAAGAASSIQESFAGAYDALTANVTDLMDYEEAAGDHLTDSQKKQLAKRIKEQKKAARAAFEAQKIAAMATAAINTALAVSQALGSAPWPYNLIPAGFALAAGIAEEAAIASTQPSFHKGGPLDLAPDEMSITARRNEYMVNPTGRTMLGDDALSKANAGMAPTSGGGSVVAVSVYKHTRQVDRWKTDGLLAGDPIAKAINAGRLVGHRAR